MSTTHVSTGRRFNRQWIEQIILELADTYQIRILWNQNTAYVTGGMALLGALIGGLSVGRKSAALGAAIGGVTGLGVAAYVNLRDIWETVKEQLKNLAYVVYNYLRQFDPVDYVRAYNTIMLCTASRRELVQKIINFIIEKLGPEVLSSITQNHS